MAVFIIRFFFKCQNSISDECRIWDLERLGAGVGEAEFWLENGRPNDCVS